jgi:hypothetical protein
MKHNSYTSCFISLRIEQIILCWFIVWLMNVEWENVWWRKVFSDLKKHLSRHLSGGSQVHQEKHLGDRPDAVPDMVSEHNRQKPRIISNWQNWVAESVYAQKTSNKMWKNWRFPQQLLFSLLSRILWALQIFSFNSTASDINIWLSNNPIPLSARATYTRFRFIHI